MTLKKILKSFLVYLFFYLGINDLIKVFRLSKTITTIIYIIGLFILVGLLIKINEINIKELLKDFKENKKEYLILIFKTLFIGLILIVVSNLIISHFSNLPQNENIIRKQLKEYPIYYILSILIFSPIIEEILFRYTFTIIKNKKIYLIVTITLFAILHLQSISNDLIYLISYLFMSITFTYPFYKTNNIINSMITHSIYNLIALITIII